MFKHLERGHSVNTNDVRFRTAEVAKLADVSLRQLQVWEEKRVAIALRSGRVRMYTPSQALFVIIVAELRRRGLSFQRLRRLSIPLRQLLADHGIVEGRPTFCAFLLTDGRQIQFADSPNKTCELVSNFFRPIVCVNLADCLERIDKSGVAQ
jgi:DNA-binding transcriptional MerR regulator